ncbi:MAG: ABC transporter permease [Firmicutes bacterium]|nr:ABC transporter permease [Bacillota bacterium]
MKAFFQLLTANMKEIFRDRMQFWWFILFPVLFVTGFGVVYSSTGGPAGEDNGIKFEVSIVKEGEGAFAAAITEAFEGVPEFAVQTRTKSEALQDFATGKSGLVIILPAELEVLPVAADNLIDEDRRIEIPVYCRPDQFFLMYAVNKILHGAEKEVLGQPSVMEIKLNTAITHDEGAKDEPGNKNDAPGAGFNIIDYILPGILAMTLMQLGLFGSIRVLALRVSRILKLLGSTPLPRGMFLAGEILIRVGMSFIQALIVIFIGHYGFGLTLANNWLYIAGWVLLGTAAFVSMGYMFTTFAKTIESGNAIMQLVQLLMMFLSGIFMPLDLLPGYLQTVMRFIPLTYLADGMRHAIAGNPSLYGITTDLAVLLGITIFCLITTVKRFRWE